MPPNWPQHSKYFHLFLNFLLILLHFRLFHSSKDFKFASFGLLLSSDSAISGHYVQILGTFHICYLLHLSFTARQIFVFFRLKFAPHLEHFVRLLLCSMIAHTGSVLFFLILIFKHLHSIQFCHQNSSSKATAYCNSSPGCSFDFVRSFFFTVAFNIVNMIFW